MNPGSSERLLILNADDFGYSRAVNAAILRAHCQGPLTSTSLMTAQPACQEAVELARENPKLGVGLHLTVIGDKTLLPAAEIPTISGPDGCFGSDPLKVGLRYAFSRHAKKELRKEITAQFERFAETGLPWSHVDGHQHYHLHPFVWDLMLELSAQYGVHRFRIPNEEVFAHYRSGGSGPNFNLIACRMLALMARRARRKLRLWAGEKKQAPFVCDRVYGLLQTGCMTRAYTAALIPRLGGHTNEIYFHPGTPHARPLPPALQHDQITDVELDALLSPEVAHALEQQPIRRVNYAEAEAGFTASMSSMS